MTKKANQEPVRFSNAFMNNIATPGRKVQGSIKPQITATSTKDKFTFNEKACIALGVKEGSRIIIIDQNLRISDPDSKLAQDERFFVAVAPEDYSQPAAIVGKQKAFSYSGVWSAMIMNNPQLTEASVQDLISAGLGILRGEEGKNYVGLKKVTADLVLYKEADEDGNEVTKFQLEEDGTPVEIYALKNLRISDHNPKSTGEGDEEATPETEETEVE